MVLNSTSACVLSIVISSFQGRFPAVLRRESVKNHYAFLFHRQVLFNLDVFNQIRHFACIPGSEVGITDMCMAPFVQRWFRIIAEAAPALVPKLETFCTLFLGEIAERTVVLPERVGLGDIFHVVVFVMSRMTVQPIPHLFEFLECLCSRHLFTLQLGFMNYLWSTLRPWTEDELCSGSRSVLYKPAVCRLSHQRLRLLLESRWSPTLWYIFHMHIKTPKKTQKVYWHNVV